MDLPFRLREKLVWFSNSILFFKDHFSTIIWLGLIAAFGRAIQLGAFGPIGSSLNITLEIMIELARVLIFLYALGLTNLKAGASRILQLFTKKNNRKINWKTAIQSLKTKWTSVLLNIAAFLMVTFVINKLIDYLAYQTCLYYQLKAGRIISDVASEWVILLFFKNLSVIPLTLIFNALFLLWVTNKLKISRT